MGGRSESSSEARNISNLSACVVGGRATSSLGSWLSLQLMRAGLSRYFALLLQRRRRVFVSEHVGVSP